MRETDRLQPMNVAISPDSSLLRIWIFRFHASTSSSAKGFEIAIPEVSDRALLDWAKSYRLPFADWQVECWACSCHPCWVPRIRPLLDFPVHMSSSANSRYERESTGLPYSLDNWMFPERTKYCRNCDVEIEFLIKETLGSTQRLFHLHQIIQHATTCKNPEVIVHLPWCGQASHSWATRCCWAYAAVPIVATPRKIEHHTHTLITEILLLNPNFWEPEKGAAQLPE